MNIKIFESDSIQDFLKINNVASLRLFGSSARSQEKNSSDIDLMVRFDKQKGLLEFVRLERELSEMLGKKVDLITENSVSHYLKKFIEKDAIIVFDGKV